MTEQVKILKPDSAPAKTEASAQRGRPPIWPFDDLEVGGAFEVPEEKFSSVRQMVSNKNRAHKGLDESVQRSWSIGKADDGKTYVWRDK
jgi:hypothetical protein